MLAKSILFIASAVLTLASPIGKDRLGTSCAAGGRPRPVLPKAGDGTELPSPPAGTTLMHIALGFGIQNYTCTSASADPQALGALAMLYDVTALYPGQSPDSLDLNTWNGLGKTVLYSLPVPLNPLQANANPGKGASTIAPFPADAPLELGGEGAIVLPGGRPIPFLGHHFFTAAGVPRFTLKDGVEVIEAKKLDAHAAPASADKGPEDTGAVAWLYLGDAGGSKGIKYVYRVLTAGGNPHSCDAEGVHSVSYATTYWFYG